MPATPSFSLSFVLSSLVIFSCPLCPKSVPLASCQQEQHEQHHGFDVTWLNHQDCRILGDSCESSIISLFMMQKCFGRNQLDNDQLHL